VARRGWRWRALPGSILCSIPLPARTSTNLRDGSDDRLPSGHDPTPLPPPTKQPMQSVTRQRCSRFLLREAVLIAFFGCGGRIAIATGEFEAGCEDDARQTSGVAPTDATASAANDTPAPATHDAAQKTDSGDASIDGRVFDASDGALADAIVSDVAD